MNVEAIDHAIILAGGKGERLRPFTQDMPKAMIPVLGQPLLAYQLSLLRFFGIRRVTICCGYLHEVIQENLGTGTKYGITIDYVVEKEPLGRGGALRYAIEQTASGLHPVLAMNGDLITNLNLTELFDFHCRYRPASTIVSVPFRSPYGLVEVGDNYKVRCFQEKPELPMWINSGIYVFEPRIFNLLPEKGDHELLTFPQLAEQGELRTFCTRAFWRSIDTVKDLNETRMEFEEFLFNNFIAADKTSRLA